MGFEMQKASDAPRGRWDDERKTRPRQRSDLWTYLEIARSYWWVIALSVVVCVAAAWWSQRGQVPEYTAEVLLQQKQESSLTSDVAERFSGGGQDFGSQVEIIRSRAVLAPVVDSVGLQLRITEKEQRDLFSEVVGELEMWRRGSAGGRFLLEARGDSVLLRDAASGTTLARAGPGEALETEAFALSVAEPGALSNPVEFVVVDRQSAIESLQGRLKIEQGKGPDLVWVRYSSPDPELSARVVNSVGRAYQSYRAETARQTAQRRRSVIAEQLVELSDSLREEQDKLMEYQRSTEALDPNTRAGALMNQRFQLQNQLQELRYEESLLEGVVAGMEGNADSSESFQRLLAQAQGTVEGISSLESRLQDLRSERQRLTSSRYGLTETNPQVEVIDTQIASTREDIRVALQEGLQRIRRRIEQTQGRLSEVEGEVRDVPARSAQHSRLQQRVTAVQEVFDNLVERYYEAQIAEGVETGGVELVDAAPVPLGPDPTHGTLSLILALVAGLVLGGVGAVTLDNLDTSVRTPEDAEYAARLEVVGVVPRISSSDRKSQSHLLAKESFRGIRTNIRFARDAEPKTVAVTSSAPGEGKSTVATNLAITYAEQGDRVALVDADLRRPQLHRMFGASRAPGLSDVLRGNAELADAVQRVRRVDRLDLIAAGSPVSNAPALLDSDAFEEFIGALRANYSAVVLDTPPLLAVTDAGVLGARVDGTLLVVRSNVTSTEVVERAVEQLRRLGSSLLGVVLNGVSVSGSYSRYGYSYYGAYAPDEDGEGDDVELLTRPPEERSA
jgi:capsular exopolysaccharide synthesis family protein